VSDAMKKYIAKYITINVFLKIDKKYKNLILKMINDNKRNIYILI
jgi:hypothetical protein